MVAEQSGELDGGTYNLIDSMAFLSDLIAFHFFYGYSPLGFVPRM
jgi:hypothetical protein